MRLGELVARLSEGFLLRLSFCILRPHVLQRSIVANQGLHRMDAYPSRVEFRQNGYRCLTATRDIAAGERVQRFVGPIVARADVPETEICHAILLDDEGRQWQLVESDARYANHSCDPNCVVDDGNYLVTRRRVAAGQELTFAYNFAEEGSDPGPWDSRWTFRCLCGAANCQGVIDRYVPPTGSA